MPTIRELKDARTAKAAELRALVDGNPDKKWTPAINARYESMLSEIDVLDAQIDRYQKVLDVEANRIHNGMPGQSLSDTANSLKPINLEHTRAFDRFARLGDDVGLRQFKIQNAMTTTSGPDGGFLIPQEMDNEIDRLARDESAMREICDGRRITTPEYLHLVSIGGVESGWVGEEETRTETDTSTLEVTKPYWGSVYAMPKVSQDMLDFSGFDVQGFLTEEVGAKFGEDEATAFITGNGIKKPRGVLDFPFSAVADSTRPFGTFRYIPSGSATSLTFDSLSQLLYGIRRGYRKNGRWLMNSTTAGEISRLKDGLGRPIWQDSVKEGEPPVLFGKPVSIDDYVSDVAAGAYPVLFGDFKKALRIVDLPSLLLLRDPYTQKGFVLFYFLRRVGMLLKNSEAIRALKIATT